LPQLICYFVFEQIFDAIVGGTAIIANRSEYAEFTQPYSDSGLQMLTYFKPKRVERAWLFKKPFTTFMWVFIGVINVYNGFVVWLIERNHNPNFRGSIWNQIGTMLTLAFTTLFLIQEEKLHSNLSRVTMVVWLFVALVITKSFTASLTSLLTVQQLDQTTIDIETLKKSGAKVGCDANSFVGKYLEVVLGFQPNNVRIIGSGDYYPQALKSGEIAAAFIEAPYVKVFLAKYCEGFITSGPAFKVGGFGFVSIH
ncbi:glutamate receptor 3.3, partial [Quercus suber]